MTTRKLEQVVLDKLFKTATHETVSVTVTATMSNGSLLGADFVEEAIADVATAAVVIDEPNWDDQGHAIGAVVDVNVAVRGCVIDASVCHFSDAGALVPASATALLASTNVFK